MCGHSSQGLHTTLIRSLCFAHTNANNNANKREQKNHRDRNFIPIHPSSGVIGLLASYYLRLGLRDQRRIVDVAYLSHTYTCIHTHNPRLSVWAFLFCTFRTCIDLLGRFIRREFNAKSVNGGIAVCPCASVIMSLGFLRLRLNIKPN